MLDGKGNVVWSKHIDPDGSGVQAGMWDFKKHVIDGRTYYSYHEQNTSGDKYGLPGYAPGERVVMDDRFREIKRITFEQSSTVDKGHFLDGHDFLMIDLDHYIMSGYIKDRVYNIPGYPDGSNVISGEMVDTRPLPSASPRPKSEPELPPPWTITPSITYNGSAPALTVAWPRTRMEEEEPGAPEVCTAVTPAARP